MSSLPGTSGYFSVEPFLQSLAVNPSLAQSPRTMTSSQRAQATQFLNTVNTPPSPAAGVALPSAPARDPDAAGNAGNNDATQQATAPAAENNQNQPPAAAANTEKPAEPKPETPLSKLMKAMLSGEGEITITRGDLTQALSLGSEVDNPEEELTLTAQEAMTLLQGSPMSAMMSRMGTQTADPLAGLGALAGGGSGNSLSSMLTALMGGGSGGNSLSSMMAALGGGSGGNSLSSMVSALTGSGSAAGAANPAIPSLAEIYDLPTLGKPDSIFKLSGLGRPGAGESA